MKKTILQQFFEVLSSKIKCWIPPKNLNSKSGFFKNENVNCLKSKTSRGKEPEHDVNCNVQQVEMPISTSKMISRVFYPFWISFLLFALLPLSVVGQCPNSYVCTPTVGSTNAKITFKFDAGNDDADRNIACDFVRKHGGSGTDPCSGGSIKVAGITYNYTGNSGGASGKDSPITLTYTTTTNVTTCPTDFQIAEGIRCGQTSDNGCLSIIFQDIITGQNCTSSNSFFSITLKDNNNCGPYTLIQSGNSALVFGTSSFSNGTYTTATIKAGIYILVFTDQLGNEHSFVYNHITEIGTCIRESNLNIVKTITSGDPFSKVGDIITYSYAVTSDAPITNPIVTDDHIVSNITTHTVTVGNNDNILEVGETWTFTGSYTVTQADLDNGSVTNIAYARGLDQNGLPIFSEVDDATATKRTCTSPTITSQPSPQTKCVGETATFTVESSGGSPEPTIQWQVFVPNGSWANLGGATDPTLTLTGVTVSMNGNLYRAVLTSGSCSPVNSDSALLTVNPTPDAPTVTAGPFCSAQGKTIADLPQGGGAYKYYFDASGGSALVGTTVLITHTYYVTTTSAQGCESSRSAVSIVINQTPDAPTVTAGPFCSALGKTIADLPQGSGADKYYFDASGGSALVGTTVLTTHTYYVTTTSVAGCESSRLAVSIVVNQTPVLVITPPASPCTPGIVDLTAAAITANSTLPSGTILTYWKTYNTTTGAVSNELTNASTPTKDAVNAGTYYIKATTEGCTDIKSVTIAVNNCGGLIYPTATTCTSFLNNQPPLDKICYTVSKKGNKTTISNATPGVFFYYATIVAPSDGSLTIEVLQFNTSNPNVKEFAVQQDQVFLFDANCIKIGTGSANPRGSGQATVTIPNAIGGRTYVISVKYDTKTIVAQTAPSADYQSYFISKVNGNVVNTTSGNILVSNCSAATLTKVATTTAKVAPIETTSFDAYPVPFNELLTIKYNFDYVSDVKIEVFNSQGRLVLSKTDTNSYLNKEVTLKLNSKIDKAEVYVVKVTTNRGSSTKKVISSK